MVEYFRPAGPKIPEIFGPAGQNSTRTEYFLTQLAKWGNGELSGGFVLSHIDEPR